MHPLVFFIADAFLRWELDAARWERSLSRAMGQKTSVNTADIRYWSRRLGAWRALWPMA